MGATRLKPLVFSGIDYYFFQINGNLVVYLPDS